MKKNESEDTKGKSFGQKTDKNMSNKINKDKQRTQHYTEN